MSRTNGKNLNDPAITQGLDDAYRVSWFGYIGPIIGSCIKGAVVFLGCTFLPPILPFAMAIWLISFFLRIIHTRCIRMYANQSGIWVYKGLFPWEKSIAGIRWQNVDEATSATGFMNWITRSYSVRVTNRYTKFVEVFRPHISHGDEFVARINEVIGQRYAGGPVVNPITRHKPAPARITNSATPSPTAIE